MTRSIFAFVLREAEALIPDRPEGAAAAGPHGPGEIRLRRELVDGYAGLTAALHAKGPRCEADENQGRHRQAKSAQSLHEQRQELQAINAPIALWFTRKSQVFCGHRRASRRDPHPLLVGSPRRVCETTRFLRASGQ
jgi:hypothetical protein